MKTNLRLELNFFIAGMWSIRSLKQRISMYINRNYFENKVCILATIGQTAQRNLIHTMMT